jgi:uncharacterized protein (UPF0335 family)
MTSTNNLTTMVRDITYYFIKYYYDKEIQTSGNKVLPEEQLREMIDRLYAEKTGELKKYIRDTLKENLGAGYSSLAVENILLEMFNDPEYSKLRVLLEIVEYQKKL